MNEFVVKINVELRIKKQESCTHPKDFHGGLAQMFIPLNMNQPKLHVFQVSAISWEWKVVEVSMLGREWLLVKRTPGNTRVGIFTSSSRASRGRKFHKKKELYSKERICL